MSNIMDNEDLRKLSMEDNGNKGTDGDDFNREKSDVKGTTSDDEGGTNEAKMKTRSEDGGEEEDKKIEPATEKIDAAEAANRVLFFIHNICAQNKKNGELLWKIVCEHMEKYDGINEQALFDELKRGEGKGLFNEHFLGKNIRGENIEDGKTENEPAIKQMFHCLSLIKADPASLKFFKARNFPAINMTLDFLKKNPEVKECLYDLFDDLGDAVENGKEFDLIKKEIDGFEKYSKKFEKEEEKKIQENLKSMSKTSLATLVITSNPILIIVYLIGKAVFGESFNKKFEEFFDSFGKHVSSSIIETGKFLEKQIEGEEDLKENADKYGKRLINLVLEKYKNSINDRGSLEELINFSKRNANFQPVSEALSIVGDQKSSSPELEKEKKEKKKKNLMPKSGTIVR